MENKLEIKGSLPEREKLPDRLLENNQEKFPEKPMVLPDKKIVGPNKQPELTPVTVPASDNTADDYHKRREAAIDSILSDGLNETFLAMSPEKQRVFKAEGEATTKKINHLLDAVKVDFGKIVRLIKHWLGLITGTNRFFLDQEAKIKADQIIKIKDKS
jgi:hypothetical protein